MGDGLIHLPAAAVAAFVALLMFRAGVHKLVDLQRFGGVMADYAIGPAPLVRLLRELIPALEIVAAAFLASGAMARDGARIAAVLLGLYAGAMTINLLRSRSEIDCGCGGPGQPISWALVVRNLVLVVALIPAAAGLAAPVSIPEALAVWAVAVAAMGVWVAADQLSANATRMRRDRETLLAGAFGAAS